MRTPFTLLLHLSGYCEHLLGRVVRPARPGTGDGAGHPRPVLAYPAAGLTGDEQGLCPQLVPRGLVCKQRHDINTVIAELGEQLAPVRVLRFGGRGH
jgi:hypothetical protein